MQVVLHRALVIGLVTLGLTALPGNPGANASQLIEDISPRPLASAISALGSGDFALARRLADRDGPVAGDYVEWVRLRSGKGTPDEVLAFLDRKAHWPGLDYLRRQSEPAFAEASDDQVRALFRGHTPATGSGALRLARALEAAGAKGEAEATIVLAWRTLDLDAEEHDAFRAHYGPLLRDHHAARLSAAIWEGRTGDTDRMLDLVSSDQAALARARIALRDNDSDVNARIKSVPLALQNDPGLAYDRFNWRIRKGLDDSAKDLLITQSAIPGGLAYPDKWSNRRRSFAREEMRAGNAQRAYNLAANHQLTEGGDYADLEWLSGYVALRYLDDPALALTHFNHLDEAVQTPISSGRAGYWRGRALDALNRPEEARAAYAAGADHQTSFYGLLAAEKAGIAFDPSLYGTDTGTDWRETPLAQSDLREAVMLLRAAGQSYDAERFLTHMAETAPSAELYALGRMVEEAGDPHLEVMLGKAAAARGIVLPRHYYAMHPMTQMTLPVSMEMALAIARRESEFDPSVTSHVGARGLMQLMPHTAQAMAEKVGDTDDVTGRLGTWAYNATLGSAYLAQLADEFSGNVLLISAGYNAGPSRSIRWSEQFGDPRDRATDPVDWIEHLPFRETRNYVQRVAESLPVYRARLGQTPLPVPFSLELGGSTISAFPPQGE